MITRGSLVKISIALFLIGLFVFDQSAIAQSRRSSRSRNSSAQAQRQAIQAQLQQAQAQLAMARAAYANAAARGNAAQGRVSNAQQTIEAATGLIKAAEDNLKATAEQLKLVEETIEDSQSGDSPLATAYAEYEQAKQEMETARARVYNSPDYKQKYQQALGSADKATLLPKVIKEAFDGHPEVKAAQDRFESAQHAYERIKGELFQKDSQWISATQASREARAELAKAQQELSNGSLHNGSAKTDLNTAARQAAAAQSVIQSNEAAIQSLQQAQSRLSNNRYGSSSNNQQKKK